MGHAHTMALKRRPELAQNPSAHWQRRSNFSSSAAALRGEQLARAVKVLNPPHDRDPAVFFTLHSDFNEQAASVAGTSAWDEMSPRQFSEASPLMNDG